MSYITSSIETLKKVRLIKGFSTPPCVESVESYDDIITTLTECFLVAKKNRNMIFFIGNGGSAAISMHMTVDFLKNGGMRTHGMHDPAVLTCLGNDYGYEHVFDKQIEMIAKSNDVLAAVSSSGESPNILNAVHSARKIGCAIITLSGFKAENSLSRLGDLNIHVPSMNYGTVESIHNMILQDVVDEIKRISEGGI